MPTAVVTIDQIVQKSGKKGPYCILQAAGEKQGYFCHGKVGRNLRENFSEGDTVEIEYETNDGGYKNVDAIAAADGAEPSRAKETVERVDRAMSSGGNRDRSIEMQVVFKGAIELASAGRSSEEAVAMAVTMWSLTKGQMSSGAANPTEPAPAAK